MISCAAPCDPQAPVIPAKRTQYAAKRHASVLLLREQWLGTKSLVKNIFVLWFIALRYEPDSLLEFMQVFAALPEDRQQNHTHARHAIAVVEDSRLKHRL